MTPLQRDLVDLDDDQLVAALATTFAGRHGLRLVRDELMALITIGLSATLVRDALTDAAANRAPTQPDVVEQLRIEAEARARVLEQPMLEASTIADLLGSAGRNRRDAASTLRRAGRIVGVNHRGRNYYPAFQFDPTSGRVRPGVEAVNKLLGARDDPWGVTSWWFSPAGRRADRHSPAELVASGDVEAVMTLAESMLDEV